MTHTSGPWEVTLQRDCGKHDTNHVVIFGEDDAPVCEVFGNSTTVDANARLIASAPDLLAACEQALSALQSANRGGYLSSAEASSIPPLVNAIAKAKGA